MDVDLVALRLEHISGFFGFLDELASVNKMRRLGQLGQVSDRRHRIVDRKQKGTEAEFGKSHLEEGFIYCRAGEDGDDLHWGDLSGGDLGCNPEAGIMPGEAVNRSFSLREPSNEKMRRFLLLLGYHTYVRDLKIMLGPSAASPV